MDDEEMIRELAKEILEGLGYSVETVKDGAEAIKAYQASFQADEPFDAVILDLSIKGGLGGKDAVKTLLKIDPRVKAIVSSGYSDDPVMKEYKKFGFSGALAKPYATHRLQDALETVIHAIHV
jgi:CheY-like chemotaxis protein